MSKMTARYRPLSGIDQARARRTSRRAPPARGGAARPGIGRRARPRAARRGCGPPTPGRCARPSSSGPSGQFVPSRMAVSIASGVATPSATADAASLTMAARMRASICAALEPGGCGPSARRGEAGPRRAPRRHRPRSRSSRRSSCARAARPRPAIAGSDAGGSADRRRSPRRRVDADGEVHIGADGVDQLERAHPEADPAHRVVDRFDARAALAEDPERLEVVRARHAVDDEARRVGRDDRRLAQPPGQRARPRRSRPARSAVRRSPRPAPSAAPG